MKVRIVKKESGVRDVIATSGDPRDPRTEWAKDVAPEDFETVVQGLVDKVDPSKPAPVPS